MRDIQCFIQELPHPWLRRLLPVLQEAFPAEVVAAAAEEAGNSRSRKYQQIFVFFITETLAKQRKYEKTNYKSM